MPRDPHYRQAADMLGNVLGADAADEMKVYGQSVEALARLFELSEAYQDHAALAAKPGQDPAQPRPRNQAA